ncbi:hypothetical protein KC363_g177 [Hortaea werneckii]|nr:hypothetical protein KC363_g177 [Hortaea werneckii]
MKEYHRDCCLARTPGHLVRLFVFQKDADVDVADHLDNNANIHAPTSSKSIDEEEARYDGKPELGKTVHCRKEERAGLVICIANSNEVQDRDKLVCNTGVIDGQAAFADAAEKAGKAYQGHKDARREPDDLVLQTAGRDKHANAKPYCNEPTDLFLKLCENSRSVLGSSLMRYQMPLGSRTHKGCKCSSGVSLQMGIPLMANIAEVRSKRWLLINSRGELRMARPYFASVDSESMAETGAIIACDCTSLRAVLVKVVEPVD